MKNRLTYIILMLPMLLLLFAGCERRPLELYYSPEAQILVKCDWSNFPEVPTGMTMYFFKDGDSQPKVITTSEINESKVSLEAGHYRMFLINQSPNEFGSLAFTGMDTYPTTESYLTAITSKWYTKADTTIIGHDPENLGVAIADEFDITPELVEQYQAIFTKYKQNIYSKGNDGTSSEDYQAELDKLTKEIDVVAYNIVSELHVKVYIKNINSLRSARASLTGMAGGYFLTKSATTDDLATQLMETWSAKIDANDAVRGYIETSITTLGLPGGILTTEGRDATLNKLSLSLLLADNTTIKTYEFNEGNDIKIERGTHGIKLELNIVLGTESDPAITLPDVDPGQSGEDSGGGFSAKVDDWGEQIDVPINL
jgi:hypothetical protein